ncbi:rod shape-determining protein MreC [Helicobacter brantae]|uniref:Rod shape-determining protein MreC n=1 Tax=Helicobacter brantae TaxID=375927 RepID=A0A3D8J2J4_9HELI|nr:rod shape-determining protein MreC [Helicobacter brantae]RDU71689.1 rod shape-determining protein MreC [Helicobacter brantae]
MRGKTFFLIVFLLVGGVIFFKIDHSLREGVLGLGDSIKGAVFDTKEWIGETYDKYFNQAQSIEELNEKLKDYQRLQLQNIELKDELNRLTLFYGMPQIYPSYTTTIRAISYYEFGNYERVWLEGFEGEKNKVYGLIVQGNVVGIAREESEGRMMGYLNGDFLCSYGVFIGEGKALGIVKGENGGVLIDYIPLGSEIKVGDKVVTNGMDNIFFENIPVGEVVRVERGSGYIQAVLKPYVDKVDLGYLWLLDRSKNVKTAISN